MCCGIWRGNGLICYEKFNISRGGGEVGQALVHVVTCPKETC